MQKSSKKRGDITNGKWHDKRLSVKHEKCEKVKNTVIRIKTEATDVICRIETHKLEWGYTCR